MNISEKGLAFIAHEEGFVPHRYRCAAGKNTIGYGHVIQTAAENVALPASLTPAEGLALLRKDAASRVASVNRLVNNLGKRPISQGAFDALVSFVFNLGEGALQRSSLLKLVNARSTDEAAVAKAFGLWRNVNGKPNAAIAARRAREAHLYFC